MTASHLGKLPGRWKDEWKAGRVQLQSYLSPLTSCSSSELEKGPELLYSAQRLQSRRTLHCVADSFTQYWISSPSCTWNVCLPVWAVRVKSGEETDQKCLLSLSAKCKVVITVNQGLRGGRVLELKKIVDEAMKNCPTVQHVLVAHRTENKVPMGKLDVPLEEVGPPRFVQLDEERLLLGCLGLSLVRL